MIYWHKPRIKWRWMWHIKYPFDRYPKAFIHYAGIGPFQCHWYSSK